MNVEQNEIKIKIKPLKKIKKGNSPVEYYFDLEV